MKTVNILFISKLLLKDNNRKNIFLYIKIILSSDKACCGQFSPPDNLFYIENRFLYALTFSNKPVKKNLDEAY